MTPPTQHDNAIIGTLRGTLATLRRLESELYNAWPGCSCERSGLCSHHAAVSEELLQSIDHLENAIRQARRVE